MRFGYYWFLRYYKRHSLVFWLAAIILGFSFHFLYKTAMMNFLIDKVKTESLQLRSINKPYMHNAPAPSLSDSSYSESLVPSRIPKSCFSSADRGCVCYDQHTIVIRDFPLYRCLDIVNGLARF